MAGRLVVRAAFRSVRCTPTVHIGTGARLYGQAAVCTPTFTETDGRTTLTPLTQLASKEDRDAVIDSGMETGMQAGWDLLEQIGVSLC